MEKSIKINDSKLTYEVLGQGKPILFLHGGPGLVHDYFKPYLQELTNLGYMVIFYDQRGNGRSLDFKIEDINIGNLISDIESIRQDLRLDKINIFGHSFGAFLALEYAKKNPKYVNKLVLCGVAPLSLDGIQKMSMTTGSRMFKSNEEMMELQMKMVQGNKDALVKFMVLSIMSQFNNKEIGAKHIADMQKYNMDIIKFFQINQKLMEEYRSIIEDYKLNINNNVLVLHGRNDAVPLECSSSLVDGLNNAKLVIIEYSGHYMFIEQTKQVIAQIKEFI